MKPPVHCDRCGFLHLNPHQGLKCCGVVLVTANEAERHREAEANRRNLADWARLDVLLEPMVDA